MPTSSPAMRAAYERTPSIQRCQEIVLALMTTSKPPNFQGPPGLPQWGHRWTVEDLVLRSLEYQRAANKLSDAVENPDVSLGELKEAFMNRYGAAVRVLAGHASRKATQEHPVRKIGGRFWALKVDPSELPAPEPCILGQGGPAGETRPDPADEARPDLEMAISGLATSLFSSPAATGENFIPLLHVIYASRKLGLQREEIGELISSGVQVALRKWEANKAATDKAMREYLAAPGEI